MTRSPSFRIAAVALGLAVGCAALGPAQDKGATEALESSAVAPPNTRSMGSVLGGAYFADEQLLDRYEALKTRLAQIREDIALGTASGRDALESLARIEEESKRLRTEVEEAKVLVSAFQVYSKTSEETFPLGDERLVIVTGDHVTVRGWDGPGIKCVVEKTILAKQQPDDSQFDAIQVSHELTLAAEKVGLTREQRDEQERAFLASEAGRKLTDEQRASRQALVDEIHHSYDDYVAFQGREANTLQLKGLTHQEGNRNLTLRINSPGGGGTMASQWQRHATMTVYVPPCKALAIRGCQAGLDIQDVECDLLLTTHDSRDRQYDGSFAVRGVKGNVTIDQAPVRVLSQVSGNVRFTATREFVNSGRRHEGGTRTFSPYATHETRIDHVEGDLQATFLRTDLRLSAIAGTLDVVNEHGSTHLAVDAPGARRACRVVSQSGSIRVDGPAEILREMPIYAYTQCGRLHTNLPREILDDANFSTGRPERNWHGFVTPAEDRFAFGRFNRPAAVLDNQQRTPGLDLISGAGTVSILTTEVAK
jgi:hypothetical protein